MVNKSKGLAIFEFQNDFLFISSFGNFCLIFSTLKEGNELFYWPYSFSINYRL